MSEAVAPVEENRKTIDLDAARRARAEARGDQIVEVQLGGKKYRLPDELPAETVHAFGALIQGDYSGLGTGMEALFGDKWDELHTDARAAGQPLSLEDETFLLEQAFELYGMPLPESPASAPS